MSIGSYSPPSTHEPLYSLSTEQPEINHTWSSRGPTFNGHSGYFQKCLEIFRKSWTFWNLF